MTRVLLLSLGLWALFLAPALCLAGGLEHVCESCPETTACEHEDDCSDDPCVDLAVQRSPQCSRGNPAPAAVTLPGALLTLPGSLHAPAWLPAVTYSLRNNLPRPQSDLPLLR